MSAQREPAVAWFQRRGELTLVFTCSGATGAPELQEVAAKELRFGWGGHAMRVRWLKPVDEATACWAAPKGGGRIQLSVRKAFEGGKRANVKADWDRWIEDEDDEDEPSPSGGPVGAADAATYSTAATARAVDTPGAPSPEPLELGPLDAEDRLERWTSMSMPQRMLTMALMWNAQSSQNRLASVRHLIELLRSAGGDLAALENIIKGGAGVLRALDTSVYGKERHASAWVAEFREKPAAQQVDLMAELFMQLPVDEQRMVVGSLM